MTPLRGDDGEPESKGTATERIVRLSEVVKGLVHQLDGIDRKLDRAEVSERAVLDRIGKMETQLAVQETHNDHTSAQHRKLERLVSKVLWLVVGQVVTAAIGVTIGVVVWLLTKG